MTTEVKTPLESARTELLMAIGLSQAQFASPDGDGLDAEALIEAIDTFEAAVRVAAQSEDTAEVSV